MCSWESSQAEIMARPGERERGKKRGGSFVFGVRERVLQPSQSHRNHRKGCFWLTYGWSEEYTFCKSRESDWASFAAGNLGETLNVGGDGGSSGKPFLAFTGLMAMVWGGWGCWAEEREKSMVVDKVRVEMALVVFHYCKSPYSCLVACWVSFFACRQH